MDPLRKVEAVQDITLMLHEQARLADLNRPEEQVLCFTAVSYTHLTLPTMIGV